LYCACSTAPPVAVVACESAEPTGVALAGAMLTKPSNAAEIAMAVIFNSDLLGIFGVYE
jgi:hypothetical protein